MIKAMRRSGHSIWFVEDFHVPRLIWQMQRTATRKCRLGQARSREPKIIRRKRVSVADSCCGQSYYSLFG